MASRSERLLLSGLYAALTVGILLAGRLSMRDPTDQSEPQLPEDSAAMSERHGHFFTSNFPVLLAPSAPHGLAVAPRNLDGDGAYATSALIQRPNAYQEMETEEEDLTVTPDAIQSSALFVTNGNPTASVVCEYVRPHEALSFQVGGRCEASTGQTLNGSAAWSFDPASDTWSKTSDAGVVRVYTEMQK